MPSPVPPLPQETASTGRSGPVGPSLMSAKPIRASDEGEVLPGLDFLPGSDLDINLSPGTGEHCHVPPFLLLLFLLGSKWDTFPSLWCYGAGGPAAPALAQRLSLSPLCRLNFMHHACACPIPWQLGLSRHHLDHQWVQALSLAQGGKSLWSQDGVVIPR